MEAKLGLRGHCSSSGNKQKCLRCLKSLSKGRCACMCAQSLQTCPTFCSCKNFLQLIGLPMSCSPPGSSVHGILQGELLHPPPGDLPNPGIKPASPTLKEDFLPLSHQGSPHRQIEVIKLEIYYKGKADRYCA